MLRELGSFRAITFTVTADGATSREGAMLISVANGQSIGLLPFDIDVVPGALRVLA